MLPALSFCHCLVLLLDFFMAFYTIRFLEPLGPPSVVGYCSILLQYCLFFCVFVPRVGFFDFFVFLDFFLFIFLLLMFYLLLYFPSFVICFELLIPWTAGSFLLHDIVKSHVSLNQQALFYFTTTFTFVFWSYLMWWRGGGVLGGDGSSPMFPCISRPFFTSRWP